MADAGQAVQRKQPQPATQQHYLVGPHISIVAHPTHHETYGAADLLEVRFQFVTLMRLSHPEERPERRIQIRGRTGGIPRHDAVADPPRVSRGADDAAPDHAPDQLDPAEDLDPMREAHSAPERPRSRSLRR